MCAQDERCTDGLTWDAECNGYGVLTMGGRKYRVRGNGKNIGATAVVHDKCAGTGMAVCGCVEFTPSELVDLFGESVSA